MAVEETWWSWLNVVALPENFEFIAPTIMHTGMRVHNFMHLTVYLLPLKLALENENLNIQIFQISN